LLKLQIIRLQRQNIQMALLLLSLMFGLMFGSPVKGNYCRFIALVG
jgi:hypothetical protein